MEQGKRMFERGTASQSILIAGGAAALLIAGFFVVKLAGSGEKGDSALLFIGLLIISLLGLAMAAAVFSGLGLSNSGEAFALPTGSVRALLAIGIMVLFVVFGLPILRSAPAGERYLAEPFETITVNPAQVATEVARLDRIGIAAVVISPGAPATGAAGTPVMAEVALYPGSQKLTGDELDLAKQLLTAIITLFTTVIGFYFGSRSATESFTHGSSRSSARNTGTGAGDNGDPLARLRQALDSASTKLATLKTQVETRIESLPQTPVGVETKQRLETALTAAVSAETAARNRLDELNAAVRQSAPRTATDSAHDLLKIQADGALATFEARLRELDSLLTTTASS